jgi:NAD(P)-dependent dehydrogenase (short-subunit alcohol dehydrogenase family)
MHGASTRGAMTILLLAPLVAPIVDRGIVLTGDQIGGAQTYLAELAGRLARCGHHVTLPAAPGSRITGVETVELPIGHLGLRPASFDPPTERTDLGGPDLLVRAAGLGSFAPVAETRLGEWDEMLDVNLRGAFLLCRAAVPGMRARGRGHVFTIVSIAGLRTFAGAGADCASTLGLLGFTRVLAEEVRRDGVEVTAVVPGAVDTPFWERAGGDLPRERMLRPEDLTAAIVFAATAPPGVHHDEIHVMPPEGVL